MRGPARRGSELKVRGPARTLVMDLTQMWPEPALTTIFLEFRTTILISSTGRKNGCLTVFISRFYFFKLECFGKHHLKF